MVACAPNLVSKTVPASVVLAVPADRIGSGTNVIDAPPTTVLSLGQFLMPRLSESDPRSGRMVERFNQASKRPFLAPTVSAEGCTGLLAPPATTVTLSVSPTVARTERHTGTGYPVRHHRTIAYQRGWSQPTNPTAK
jgi:hypothetical protein